MGVCTKVNLDGRVEFENVLAWIKDNVDKDAVIRTYKKEYYSNETVQSFKDSDILKEQYGNEKPYSVCTYIDFSYDDRRLNMFMWYSNINTYENYNYYADYGLENMVTSETTHASLYYCEESKEIARKLVTAFGGWIDYNDCDEEPYVRINKGTEAPKKVRHVTLEEVYEAFGEVVIIDK